MKRWLGLAWLAILLVGCGAVPEGSKSNEAPLINCPVGNAASPPQGAASACVYR